MNNTSNTNFIVSLDQFEGPLDLLYQLIERRKLQINTISLAKITADYISHIRQAAKVPAEEIARFVHIASILVLIKSKSLLPLLEYTKEEEVDVAVLEDRMRLYSYIQKHAVPSLDHWDIYSFPISPPGHEQEIIFAPDASCTSASVHRNALLVIKDLSSFRLPLRKKARKLISIEAVISRVLDTLTNRISVSFSSVVSGRKKQEKIVSFLAILELMRKDLLTAEQGKEFDDILLTKQERRAML